MVGFHNVISQEAEHLPPTMTPGKWYTNHMWLNLDLKDHVETFFIVPNNDVFISYCNSIFMNMIIFEKMEMSETSRRRRIAITSKNRLSAENILGILWRRWIGRICVTALNP